MSKKINTTSIGLFIVTGVALGVTGLLLFSSSKLFSRTEVQIIYFDNSLNGLNEGAPVKYRGVTIGTVKRVMVRFNQATNDNSLPVIIEVEEKLLRKRMGDESMAIFTKGSTQGYINRGLRATLQSESLVTGVLYVGLDFDPDAPPPVLHQLTKIYVEIPSKPTQTQELLNNLASLDIKSIEENLNRLLTTLNTSVSNLQMAELSAGVTNDLAAVQTTLEQFRLVGEKLNTHIDPLADSITNTLAGATLTLDQLRGTGENLRTMLAPDSPLRNNLDQALQQLAGASESISSLAEFLKQHPNALITGRESQPK